LSDANSICRFLASKNDKVVLIGNDTNGSIVDQWLELEQTQSTDSLVQKLNDTLSKQENKKNVVNGRTTISLADIVLFSTLFNVLKTDSNQRDKYPAAAQWFDGVIAEKFVVQGLKLAGL
jgi:glutathione S-transferase